LIIYKFAQKLIKYAQNDQVFYSPDIYGCKCCGYSGRLHKHGKYFRNYINIFHDQKIPIQRYKCPNKSCNTTTSAIPDFLIPYYQYSFATVIYCLYLYFHKKISCSKIEKKLNFKVSRQLVNHFAKRFKTQLGLITMFFSNCELDIPLDFQNRSIAHKCSSLIFNIWKFVLSVSFNFNYFNFIGFHFMKRLN